MILLIDNYDSFTFNISNIFKFLNYKVKILNKNNLKKIFRIKSIDFICLGPGTSFPKIKDFLFLKKIKHIPILGICLGNQIIGKLFGCQLKKSINILHGEKEKIYSKNSYFLNNLPLISKYCRYNSITLKKDKNLNIISFNKNKEPMFIVHKKYNIVGIQYHPESILSFYGIRLLKNICFYFKNLCLKK